MHALRKIPYYLVVALLVYMPFHIFLSQSLSLATGGLDYWKIAKDVFLFLALIFTGGLVFGTKKHRQDKQFSIFLLLSLGYLLVHFIIWRINPDISSSGAILGSVYNSRLLGYGLLGWGAVLVYPGKVTVTSILRIILVISTVVALLGILQYYLPKDILTHVGYSLDRGVKPAFYIDDKPDLPRIMSTLRDPNSLGAYLILPITILTLAWFKKRRLRIFIAGLFLLHSLALFLSFSRSAWIGALLSIMLVTLWGNLKYLREFFRKSWVFLLAFLVIFGVGTYIFQDQYAVKNIIFHADENTKLADSNTLHTRYALEGLEGIAEKPLGHGPGTAGLVSIRSKKVMLTEDYFIQIGYEVGIIGLVLLLGACFIILRRLYKSSGILPRSLLASFAGITVCALLLLTWSNEAVAATWWLTAGLVQKKT